MWETASDQIEVEAAQRAHHVALARAEAHWPFLAKARSKDEFGHRLALVTTANFTEAVVEEFTRRFAAQQVAASLRDFMDAKSGKTGTCKHCGGEIEELAGGGWQIKGGGPASDICIKNKGTTTRYGGEHQPRRQKSSSHAPYNIEERDGKWVVVNSLGEVKGTFDSEEQARQQQKALYANVPGAAEQAKKESGFFERAKEVAQGLSNDPYSENGQHFPHRPGQSPEDARAEWEGSEGKREMDARHPKSTASLEDITEADVIEAMAILETEGGFFSPPRVDPTNPVLDRLDEERRQEHEQDRASHERERDYWREHPDERDRHITQNAGLKTTAEADGKPSVCPDCGKWRNPENCPHCDAQKVIDEAQRFQDDDHGPVLPFLNWFGHGLFPSGAAASASRIAADLPASGKYDTVFQAVQHILSESGGKRGAKINDVAYLMQVSTDQAKRMIQSAVDSGKIEQRGSTYWPSQRTASRIAADEYNLYGTEQETPFSQVRQPRTTRPRQMPHPSPQVGYSAPAAPDFLDVGLAEQPSMVAPVDYSNPHMPSFEQAVAARVARIASRVAEDNPHLSEDSVREIALATLSAYPQMVKR